MKNASCGEPALDLDLPYLFAPQGRSRRYYYYRRAGVRLQILAEDGHHLDPEHELSAFLARYNAIHENWGKVVAGAVSGAPGVRHGSLAHAIQGYRSSPEFRQIGDKTKKDYIRILDRLSAEWGSALLKVMPANTPLKIRNKYADTPRTANYAVAVFRLVLKHVESLPENFGLDDKWLSGSKWPEKLKTGAGHDPWEEWQIKQYREHWKPETWERVAFELLLNTGQRGGDVVEMARNHYDSRGVITVPHQNKTGVRVEVPASQELRAVLDPWLKDHQHLVILAGERGKSIGVDYFRHRLIDAYKKAGLGGTDDKPGVTTHGLRYTAATVLYELGIDWVTISDVTGHQTMEMARKYTDKRRRTSVAITRLDGARKERQGS